MRKHLIKNSILRGYMPIIVFFFIGIIFFISEGLYVKNEYKRLKTEYPRIKKEDSINDFVLKIKSDYKKILRLDVNHVDLILSSNKKISIQAYLNDSTGEGIYKTLEGNDLIKKTKGSDTMYIYKKNSHSKHYDYYFLLDLNE